MTDSTLPDPDQHPEAAVVIYDGKCNFCRGGVDRLHWLDLGKRLAFISLHDPRVAERFSDLTFDQMMDQMWIVDNNGKRYGGGDAVRFLTRRLPVLWIAMPILHLPGTARLWRWAYHQVARRRYQIAGKQCDDGTCKVHLGP